MDRLTRAKANRVLQSAQKITDSSERRRYLSRVCASDPELRREVDSILQSDEEAEYDGFLEARRGELDGGGSTPSSASRSDPRIGTQIGKFEIVGIVGEGAMGVVYKAI